MKTLQEKLAVATTELASKRGKKGTHQRPTTTLEYHDALRTMGKKFSMTEDLWLDPGVFNLPNSSTLKPRSVEWFVSDDTYDHGMAVALYEAVPELHHKDMVNLSEFR